VPGGLVVAGGDVGWCEGALKLVACGLGCQRWRCGAAPLTAMRLSAGSGVHADAQPNPRCRDADRRTREASATAPISVAPIPVMNATLPPSFPRVHDLSVGNLRIRGIAPETTLVNDENNDQHRRCGRLCHGPMDRSRCRPTVQDRAHEWTRTPSSEGMNELSVDRQIDHGAEE